ncbi:MAG: inositol monophosphatase family protein [Pseudomonadota bacterium]
MHPYVNNALRAARTASGHLLRAMDRLDTLEVSQKAVNDFVSNVDREAEEIIADALHQAYPDHGVRGEERGQIYPEGEYNWVIDPLDGTLNYIQGIPHFCISIAALKGRRVEHAIIVDPTRNEEFTASRGAGAALNGRRLRVAQRRRIDESVLATGIPPHAIRRHHPAYSALLNELREEARGMRRMGSAALDLAYVAAGRVDGFFELGLSLWDIAAGVLLVQEAGGFSGDFGGGDQHLASGNIIAANDKLFRALVARARPHLTAELRAEHRRTTAPG